MKFYLIPLIASSITLPLWAQPDPAAFVSGENVKFSTSGHAKANGLNLNLSYPKGWVAKEGQGPHILQKFISSGGSGTETITILVKPLPEGLGEEELKYFVSEEGMKDMLPEGTKSISLKTTKIDGIPAGMSEYLASGERLGVVSRSRTLSCLIPYQRNLISVSFSVTTLDKQEDIEARFRQFRPLFFAAANTISLPDKWK